MRTTFNRKKFAPVKGALAAIWGGYDGSLATLARKNMCKNASCPHCGQEDTPMHRLICVSQHGMTVQDKAGVPVKQVAKYKLQKRRTDEEHPSLFGVFARVCPPEQIGKSQLFVHEHLDAERFENIEDAWQACTHAAGDGSCFEPTSGYLAHAGWAIAGVTDDRKLAAAIYGLVPGYRPQTAQCGEHLAGIYSLVQPTSAELHFDCKAVLQCSNNPAAYCLAPSNKYAGLWKEAYELRDGRPFHKVQAHTEIGIQSTIGEVANDFADTYAKKGARLHDIPFKVLQSQARARATQRKFLFDLANCYIHWQQKCEEQPAKPEVAKRPAGTPLQRCVVASAYGAWRCPNCLKRAKTRQELESRPCVGPGTKLMAVLAKTGAYGHQMCAATTLQTGCSLFVCILCGAYAESKPSMLNRPCPGLKCINGKLRRGRVGGDGIISRLLRGLHPCRALKVSHLMPIQDDLDDLYQALPSLAGPPGNVDVG